MLFAAVAPGVAVGARPGCARRRRVRPHRPGAGIRPRADRHEATTGSLVIVGITAATAAVGPACAGHVQWRRGLLLAAAGVPAALLGTAVNRLVDNNVLLLAFAALMLVALHVPVATAVGTSLVVIALNEG